jgi:hypothetical protein
MQSPHLLIFCSAAKNKCSLFLKKFDFKGSCEKWYIFSEPYFFFLLRSSTERDLLKVKQCIAIHFVLDKEIKQKVTLKPKAISQGMLDKLIMRNFETIIYY